MRWSWDFTNSVFIAREAGATTKANKARRKTLTLKSK
jgi:hypothetical protein